MFRRRRFIRPMMPPISRRTGQVPPALQRANALAAAGNFSEAAIAYEELARLAVDQNGPRASWLLLLSGRMRLQAGQVQVAMTHLQQGLRLFAPRGKWKQLQAAGSRSVEELKGLGYSQQAGELEALVISLLPPGLSTRSTAGEEPKARRLPGTCPACGGSLRSDEVEWIDDYTAECLFCGSVVRVED
jgi:tetratricopeptide (TPR) repeat protein